MSRARDRDARREVRHALEDGDVMTHTKLEQMRRQNVEIINSELSKLKLAICRICANNNFFLNICESDQSV